MPFLPVAVGLLLQVAATQGAPASLPLGLEWEAPCSTREQIEQQIARILSQARGPQRAVVARARVLPAERGGVSVELSLEIEGKRGSRAFEAESCGAAESATVVILALAINPNAPVTKTEQAPAEPEVVPQTSGESSATLQPGATVQPETPRGPTRQAPKVTSDASRTRSQPPDSTDEPALRAFTFAASALLDLGTLPRVAGGGEIALGYLHENLRAEGAMGMLASQSETVAPSGAGADFRSLSAELRGGFVVTLGRLWLTPFVGFGVQRLSASGFGGSIDSFEHTKLLPLVAGGAFAEVQLFRHFALRGSIEAQVPLSRPEFIVSEPAPQPAQQVHEPSVVSGRIFLGPAVHFF